MSGASASSDSAGTPPSPPPPPFAWQATCVRAGAGVVSCYVCILLCSAYTELCQARFLQAWQATWANMVAACPYYTTWYFLSSATSLRDSTYSVYPWPPAHNEHCVARHCTAAKHWSLMLRHFPSTSAARGTQSFYAPVCKRTTLMGLTQEVPVFQQRVSRDHHAFAEGQAPAGNTSRSIQERSLDWLTQMWPWKPGLVKANMLPIFY